MMSNRLLERASDSRITINLSSILGGLSVGDRLKMLLDLFDSLSSRFEDRIIAQIIPLIPFALKEARDETKKADNVPTYLYSDKSEPEAQLQTMIGLLKLLPRECEGDKLFIETKRAIFSCLFEQWSRVEDDVRAETIWQTILGLDLVTGDQNFRGRYSSVLPDALRSATGDQVKVGRLNQAILSLIDHDSHSRKIAYRRYPLFRYENNFKRQSEVDEMNAVLRVFLIARARNVSLKQPYRPDSQEVIMTAVIEIEILAPLEGLSDFAYKAMEDEAEGIAAQDRASQVLYSQLQAGIRGINLVLLFLFPNRQTISIRLVWDGNLDRSDWVRPKDKDLHHAVEIALDLASKWRKERINQQLTSYKMEVMLCVCDRVWGDTPKQEVVFRQETVK